MDKPSTPPNAIDRANTEVAEDVERLFASGVLTPRKRRMIEAYVRHGTYTAASKASGYGPDTVKKYVTTDAAVRRAIGELVDQAALVTGITLERVLQEYGRLAFSDVGEVLELLQAHGDPDEALAVLADLPADVTAAISKIEISRKMGGDGGFETGSFKVHFWDKKGALSDLGRMLSVFNDKLTIEDNSGFGERLQRALEKIEGVAGE